VLLTTWPAEQSREKLLVPVSEAVRVEVKVRLSRTLMGKVAVLS